MTENNGWEKIESDMLKWENEGQELEGVFIDRQHSSEYHNYIYTVSTDDGDVTFWGSTVLNTKLNRVDEGDRIKIILTEFKEHEKKGYSPIKMFDVFVKHK